jgi:glycosyltransferase involved in cell wall biosynthesis
VSPEGRDENMEKTASIPADARRPVADSDPAPPIRLAICGVYPVGAGYPNTTYLLRAIREDSRFAASFLGATLAEETALWRIARGRSWRGLLHVMSWLARSMSTVAHVLWRHARSPFDATYIPYPSLVALLAFRVVPRRWRPPLIADGFISVWDSMVRDRRVVPEQSKTARMLLWMERAALRTADAVHVDTQANKTFLAQWLRIDADRIRVVPLVIDEILYVRSQPPSRRERCRVLYIGTFVPLHGVGVICDAIRKLRDTRTVDFVLAGTGQDAKLLSDLIAESGYDHVRWINRWCSSAELLQLIEDADICLGTFGTTDKAGRVFPFKNYLYARCGRPIVSSVPCGFPGPAPIETPFFAVPSGDGDALALAIEALANDPALREEYAGRAARYYDQQLGTVRAVDCLVGSIAAVQRAQDQVHESRRL